MADRQERRLMRQRGAGPRELKNAAFNFSFGAAPLAAPLSSRRTPRPLSAQPSSRKTPQAHSRRLSTRETPAGSGAKSTSILGTRRQSGSVARSSVSRTSDGPSSSQRFKTPTVTGKRRRGGDQLAAVEESDQDELEPTAEDIMVSMPMSVRPSIEVPMSARKTPAIRSLNEDEDEEEDELSPEQIGGGDELAVQHSTRSTQTPTTLRRLLARSRGRSRTRKSATSAPSRASITTTVAEEEEEDELSFEQEQMGIQSASKDQTSSSGLAMITSAGDSMGLTLTAPNNQSTRREVYEISDQEDSEDELTPPQAKVPWEAAGEDNIAQDLNQDELTPVQTRKSRASARKSALVVEDAVEDNASADELTPAQPKNRRRSGKKPIQVHEDVVEAEDEAGEHDELPPPIPRTTTTQKRRPPLSTTTGNAPKRPKKSKSSYRSASPPRKKASGATVPITVYRRTEPKNMAYDPLGADPTPGLTPVDVLAQISGELATNYITSFAEAAKRSSTASKKTMRRQVNALTSFREILQDSFFELQVAHGTSHILASHVRAANKQKRQLRAELMTRRREREELDLQIDKLRAEHVARMEKEEKQQELVHNLRDIELAVRKGREKARDEDREDEEPETGIEILVGSALDTIGLLGKVRQWNGVLEESAALLEARA